MNSSSLPTPTSSSSSLPFYIIIFLVLFGIKNPTQTEFLVSVLYYLVGCWFFFFFLGKHWIVEKKYCFLAENQFARTKWLDWSELRGTGKEDQEMKWRKWGTERMAEKQRQDNWMMKKKKNKINFNYDFN